MKHCQRVPSRWDFWGAGLHRWHALFCAECRRSGAADRLMARSARQFRRELRRNPVPPGLETDILARLGIAEPAGRSERTRERGNEGTIWPQDRVAGPRPVVARWALSGVAAAAALAILGGALVLRIQGLPRPTTIAWGVGHPGSVQKGQIPGAPRLQDRLVSRSDPGTTLGAIRLDAGGTPALPGGPLLSGPRAWLSASRSLAPSFSRPLAPSRPGDDLNYINEDPIRLVYRWAPMPADAWAKLEADVRKNVHAKDDFVQIPLPRLVSANGDALMVQAVESYKREAAVLDARLFRKVTLAFKATALSDLCDHLRSTSGIALAAGSSVADEKVTVFCKETALRDVMRQLSRPFGYAWVRSGKQGEYRYELVQDLRSQLLEEELRQRDRHAALVDLEREMDRYRPYLNLTPDEALARAKTAPPAEKKLLEYLGSYGWGPVHMYFRLSPNVLARLRDGQTVTVCEEEWTGSEPLPKDLSRGILQSRRDWKAFRLEKGGLDCTTDLTDPRGLVLTSVPEMRAYVTLSIRQDDLGQFTFNGDAGFFASGAKGGIQTNNGPYAAGRSPAVTQPENRKRNARFARETTLRRRVALRPRASCQPSPGTKPGAGSEEHKVTSADVLEALHRATGVPVVADYYTRLHPPAGVSVREKPLFDALNHVSDAMRMHWDKDGEWLQFRSTSFYDDRLKEVPNRLLNRWAAARRQKGTLSLDDMVEIAQLPDAQLEGAEMAEGARDCYGLAEWNLASNYMLRPHLRFLAGFTPAQRQEAQGAAGLSFTKMTLAQQQQFLSHALGNLSDGIQSLSDLSGAALRVDYTVPGWFEWRPPGPQWLQWVVPTEPGKRAIREPLRARTREAVLQAVRGIDPQMRRAMLDAARRTDPRIDEGDMGPNNAQIVATAYDLAFIYVPSNSLRHAIHVLRPGDTRYVGGEGGLEASR